jgi:RNA polymerase sigma factor (sigma-70 family)
VGRNDPLANPEQLIPRVYAYVAYRLGHGSDAEDVTSDVFERALRYRDSYDSGKGDAIAWLFGIARRCVTETLRTRAETDEVPDSAAPGDLEADAIRRLHLRAAIESLDERGRELIALRYGADLSTRQIAALLEVRTNTVEVALHRALTRLRTRLEPQADSPGEGSRTARA